MGQKIIDNFTNKVAGRVAVPLSHTDQPEFNAGELVGLEIKDDGLYGRLDIRDPKTQTSIENDLIWDVSVSFDNRYMDKKSGAQVGPALLHVSLVNNPYLKGMAPFQALASRMNATMLSENEALLVSTKVTNDREFPVQVEYKDGDTVKSVTLEPGQEVEVTEEQYAEVHNQVITAEKPEEAPVPTPEEKAAAEAAAKEAADKEAADKAEAEAKAQAERDAEGGNRSSPADDRRR